MSEQQLKTAFIQGASDRLDEIISAVNEVQKQLKSKNEPSVKLGVAWAKICHEFMLEEAPKMALLAIQEKPVYPH
jgi:HEAT repeat protein